MFWINRFLLFNIGHKFQISRNITIEIFKVFCQLRVFALHIPNALLSILSPHRIRGSRQLNCRY